MNDGPILEMAIAKISFLKGWEKIALLEKHLSEGEFSACSFQQLQELVGRTVPVDGSRWNPMVFLEEAYTDAKAALRHGIQMVPYGEPSYPPLLRELSDPPLVLYYRGTLPDPEVPMISIVGTRLPSGAGRAQAYQLGYEFGLAGIPVVSGLARGIDSMAHRGNVEGRGRTVAVLGCGVDTVYPHSNRALAGRILETGGCIMSEYPPGTPPYKWNFPLRNRIIAALGRSLIVVEAGERSGALISAQFALDAGRDVYVGSVCQHSVYGQGGRNLYEQGAAFVDHADNILKEWKAVRSSPMRSE
ncbi:MAG: DNA-processing protein DprA [Termitinemataceae bacterium]